MRTLISVFSLAVFLASCGSQSEPPVEVADRVVDAPPPPEDGRPVLVAAGLDIVPTVAAVSAPWDVEPIFEFGNYSPGVDLVRRETVFPRGMIVVDRASKGGIYMIKVYSGRADNCGAPEPVDKALGALLQVLELPSPSDLGRRQLIEAWAAKTGMVEVPIGDRAMATAVGGCLPVLVLKAI